jgi:homospermidine synthase
VLTRENLRQELAPWLAGGGFCINLSVEVAFVALMGLCRDWSVLYLDTCIEPWPGGYTHPSLSVTERSNYGLRESARALRHAGTPTRPR